MQAIRVLWESQTVSEGKASKVRQSSTWYTVYSALRIPQCAAVVIGEPSTSEILQSRTSGHVSAPFHSRNEESREAVSKRYHCSLDLKSDPPHDRVVAADSNLPPNLGAGTSHQIAGSDEDQTQHDRIQASLRDSDSNGLRGLVLK